MANLNLSEFTEKLFVADADHTFIWDTDASISKRVSRNSWLSGTTANCRLGLADAASPVAQTISVQSVAAGTTNTAGAAFTIDGSQGTGTGAGGALIFRTAAAGSSGSTQNAFGTAMLITADKRVVPTGLTIDGSGLFEIFNDLASAQGRTFPARSASIGRLGICYRADAQIAWSPGNGSSVDGGNMGTADTILLRDAANTLALRNGANAQTFRVYNTYSNAGIDVEYLQLSTSAIGFRVGTNSSGSGSSRPLFLGVGGGSQWQINTAGHIGTYGSDNLYDIGASGANRPRNVYVGNSVTTGSIAPNSGADLIFNGASTGAAWKITPSGHFHAFADNAYDIGASGANRPRNVYVANNVTVGNTVSTGICDVTAIRLAANGSGCVIRQDSNGIIRLSNNNESDFTRLQFGGATDAAPAIARDGAGIKFTGAAAGSTAWIKVPPVAVGSLPLAATAGAGARAFVNDASAPVFGTAVAGGGAVLVPVYCTGSAWNVG